MSRNPFYTYRRFLLAILLLMGTSIIHAQDDTGTTVDSVVQSNTDSNYEVVESADDDDEKQKPDTATMRQVPDSVVNNYKNRKEFEYANDPDYWKKKQGDKESQESAKKDIFEVIFGSRAAQVFMYIILGLVIIFVIYRIIVNNSLFYRKRKIKDTNEITEEEELTTDNLESKLGKAVSEGDYRSAVRYLYIKGLHKLDARGWIRYHSQATNYDYLNQVSKYKVANDFNFLTRVYEYVWYGEFGMSPEQFQIVRNNFEKMYNEIGA